MRESGMVGSRAMRNLFPVMAVLLVSVLPLRAQTPRPARTADDVAKRTIEMLAGPAWEKARYFAFTFNVISGSRSVSRYAQRWDRQTGNYRVSGRGPKGDEVEVIMNVNTGKGRAWREGKEVDDTIELLDFAYRRFVNDTYWLLMPLKSMEPGVSREYIGERTDSCGTLWDLVKLTFGTGAGQDQSWMWVNRDTGLVDEWDMKPANTRPEDPAVRVYFHDYRRVGGLLVS